MKRGDRQLPAIGQRTLEMAGLLGREFSLSLLQEAVGGSAGIEELFEKGEIGEGKGPEWGRFAKTGAAKKVVEGIPWSRRRTYLEALGGAAERLRYPPEEIAPYFEGGRRFEVARGWWIKAARKACAAGAYRSALGWLDRALAIWPWTEMPEQRVEVLRELARCAVNGGKAEAARRAWEELADYGADAGEPAIEVEALRQLAGLGSDGARVSEVLCRAAEVSEAGLSSSEAVRDILAYVDKLACGVHISAAARELDRAVRIAEAAADPAVLSEVRGWQGLIAAMSGKHARAAEYVEESLRIAVEHELAEKAALAYRRRANIRDYGGRYAEEKQAQAAAIDYCRASGVDGELICLGCLSYACLRTGDWQEAIDSARSVIRDKGSPVDLRALARCVLGLVHAFRGERGPASRHLEAATERFRTEGFAGMEFFALWGMAYLRHADGDMAGAVEVFDRIRALWRTTDDVHDVVPAMFFAGGVYADAGHADRLADCLDILGRVVRAHPLGEAKAALIALQGEQARRDGRQGDFEEGLAEASGRYAALGLPVEQLWAECRLAVHGRGAEGGGSRREAAALAKRLGARPMLALLEGGGGAAAAGDLTPRQSEVLGFLAAGLTSKEIADRLGLSTRTVEMHVGGLLQRLNCRTRPEAVRTAIERGWLAAS